MRECVLAPDRCAERSLDGRMLLPVTCQEPVLPENPLTLECRQQSHTSGPLLPGTSGCAPGETMLQEKSLPHGTWTSNLSPHTTTRVWLVASIFITLGCWKPFVWHAPIKGAPVRCTHRNNPWPSGSVPAVVAPVCFSFCFMLEIILLIWKKTPNQPGRGRGKKACIFSCLWDTEEM